ncbi:MAG TPA: FadR/GntR family transcriptional regulator [Chloroflexota bacterium]|nr:FadR/GntR family transcriptional regulator [Chloroflexota bacterium]
MSDPAALGVAHPSGIRARPVSIAPARLAGRPSVIDSIVDEIVDRIASGELKDGDMLASQDELARSLGVSRASLREAPNRLNLLGLVESRHGSGTFVKTARPQHFMSSLSSLLVMDRSSVAELLEARLQVESAVAFRAARAATAEEIQQMGTLIEQMKRDYTAGQAESLVDRDACFHLLVSESSRNRVLMKVLEIIREILPGFIRKFLESYPDAVLTNIGFHEAIYLAVKNREPEEARRRMEEHINFLIALNASGGDHGAPAAARVEQAGRSSAFLPANNASGVQDDHRSDGQR